LAQNFGFQDYGAKHFESILTRFFQGYYLPTKFGVDKRKAHFSSLILSGQMKRSDTLKELKVPAYPHEQMERDKIYIPKKLGISIEEWEQILALPPRLHSNFPSSEMLFAVKDFLVHLLKIRVGYRG